MKAKRKTIIQNAPIYARERVALRRWLRLHDLTPAMGNTNITRNRLQKQVIRAGGRPGRIVQEARA